MVEINQGTCQNYPPPKKAIPANPAANVIGFSKKRTHNNRGILPRRGDIARFIRAF
jgi:hypothetical protein